MTKFEKYLKAKVLEYQKVLGIDMQSIEIEYKKDISYMQMVYTYPYINPILKYSDNVLRDFKDGKVKDQVIIHELTHILTDPLYAKAASRYVGKDEIEDERERLTDIISTIIHNLIK